MKPQTVSVAAAALVLTACQSEITVPTLAPGTPLASAVASTEKRTPFETFDFWGPECLVPPSEPGVVTVTGNTLHIRDVVNHSYTVSTSPLVTGPENVWVDADVNLENGAGSFHGILELVPTALGGSGTWRGSFGAHLKGGQFAENPLTLVDAHMVLHGTGALEGLTLMFDHFANINFAHPAPPFPGCEFDGEKLVGVILDPRG